MKPLIQLFDACGVRSAIRSLVLVVTEVKGLLRVQANRFLASRGSISNKFAFQRYQKVGTLDRFYMPPLQKDV